MVSRVLVEKIGTSKNGCNTILYRNKSGTIKKAAVAETISIKEGDVVWLLRDDHLNYNGFNAVAFSLE